MDKHPALMDSSRELAEIASTLGLSPLGDALVADAARRLERRVLRVVVLGEIKHGKSSLINALTGVKLMPTGVTPTTGATVEVTAGDPAGLWLVTGEGQVALDDERFDRLARGRESAPGLLRVTVAGGVVDPGVELVDTPGINDIDQVRGLTSRGQLPRGDVLVFVLDATQALNRAELKFLRDAVVAVGPTSATGAAILVALNRIDMIPEDERAGLREHVERELAALADDSIEIFETDAKAALKDPESDSHGVRGLARLRARVDELRRERDELLPRRARAALVRAARLLSYNAAIQARALTLEEEALRAEISAVEGALDRSRLDFEQLRATVEDARARILRESRERTAGFGEELRAQAFAQLARPDLRFIADLLPGAIQDALTHFSHAEIERLRHALDALTREVLRTHGHQARRRLHELAVHLGFRGPAIHMLPPSVRVEVGLLTVGVIGTAIMYFGNFVAGLVIAIAGPLATMVLRERSVREIRASAEALLPDALKAGLDGLDAALQAAVDRHVRALEEHLVLANEHLGEQLAAVLTRAGEHGDAGARAAALAELEGRVAACAERLERLEL